MDSQNLHIKDGQNRHNSSSSSGKSSGKTPFQWRIGYWIPVDDIRDILYDRKVVCPKLAQTRLAGLLKKMHLRTVRNVHSGSLMVNLDELIRLLEVADRFPFGVLVGRYTARGLHQRAEARGTTVSGLIQELNALRGIRKPSG